jgi:hypothetical protein
MGFCYLTVMYGEKRLFEAQAGGVVRDGLIEFFYARRSKLQLE